MNDYSHFSLICSCCIFYYQLLIRGTVAEIYIDFGIILGLKLIELCRLCVI